MVQEHLSTVDRPEPSKPPTLRYKFTPKINTLVGPSATKVAAPPAPNKFKTLPSPSLAFSDISEESVDESSKPTPRVVVTRPSKPHKTRTASCSSSDASDEDSENRKKRKFKSHLPPAGRRRDSNDDSSDSGGPGGHSAGGGAGGGEGGSGACLQADSSRTASDESGGGGSSSGGGSSRRHATGFRRRCGTAGETRLRESQSLNRITEVQESSENLLAATTANNNTVAVTAAAVSPRTRSRSGLGARFMLFVGGGKKSSSSQPPDDAKENKSGGSGATSASSSSSTKITKYFHLHRKLCLPLFKPAASANSAENVNNVVWIPDKT